MTKSQFNIKISKDLLIKVKRQAMMSGKSLTEHVTDLIRKSLSENNIKNNNICSPHEIIDLEKRILAIESIVRNREYLSQKPDPFSDSEAVNCTNFMKGVFDNEVEKRNIDSKEDAFNDLYKHINFFDKSSKILENRCKDIFLSDNPKPWTGKELNDLVGEDKCNCPIRKGLIHWTGKIDCPSQQEICDKGKILLNLF
tara:strand:+ start:1356 stop:1949 length:594 start_codon:yes stop_codon:yes gene_type:complete